ncbi:MAG TPA: Hsp20/alpha crystallin family protein [Micromonosporaceae bacterium]|jgi:HSP20 family molecular chaperone IbpA
MTSLVPRLFSELNDWFDQDWALRGSSLIRLEDRVTDTEYTIRAELPGLDPEKDVQINVSNGVLTIHAERREEFQAQHRSEFRYGMLQRSVRLPGNADESSVKAHYSQGILEITVPLKAQPEPQRIAIIKS